MPDPVPTVLVLDPAGIVAAAVEEALALLPSRPELLVSRTGAIPQHLMEPGLPVVIVAAPSWTATAAKLRRVGTLARQLPQASLMLAIADRPAATLRELVQTGADDLLAPRSTEELAAAIARGLRITQRRVNRPVRVGRLTTVASPTGGAGKTFLATNLASYVGKVTGERVVLVDLDLQFGEVCTALRLRPESSISDAVAAIRNAENDAEGDAHLAELLLTHEGGFSVLAAPADPVEADSVTAADVELVLAALRRVADHVIVDTPAGLPPLAMTALRMSDQVVALGTPGRPSLHNLDQFLKAVSVVTPPRTEVSCILNQQPEDTTPDLSDFPGRFGDGFVAVLPYDREASRSINYGVPLVLASGTCPLSRALATSLPKLLAGGDRTPVLRAPAGFHPPVVEIPALDDEWDEFEEFEEPPVEVVLDDEPEPVAAEPPPLPCVAASARRRPVHCRHRSAFTLVHDATAAPYHPSRPDWPSGRPGTAGPQRQPKRLRGPPGPDPPTSYVFASRPARGGPACSLCGFVSRAQRASTCRSRWASSPLLSRITSATARRSASVA
jgi:pilus assembly protein CpaE